MGITDPYLAEVEIYHKAAAWLLDQEKIDQKGVADATGEVLDRGLLRASQQVRARRRGSIRLAMRDSAPTARIDGSIQPYAVAFPADYGKDRLASRRVDVVLHGRNDVSHGGLFLHEHDGLHNIPADQDWVQIDIFGRGNNAYRWAGELTCKKPSPSNNCSAWPP